MAMFDNLLVEKYRPKTLDDIVLSESNRNFFEEIVDKQEIPNIMFSGKAGIGKSSLAKIIVNDVLDCQYLYINASDESGIDTIRSKVVNFSQTMSFDGKLKVVILDEVDGLSTVQGAGGRTSAQQALRNVMEEYAANTRFILTCNYPYKVIDPIKSRCQEFDLTPPFEESVKRIIHILKQENIKVENGSRQRLIDLIKSKYPDIRKIINNIQKRVVKGELIITDDIDDLEFAEKIVGRLVNKKDIFEIRKYIIKNETLFANDYHQLLKNIYEVFYEVELEFNKKRQVLLCIGAAMYQNQIVLDTEINCYNCLLGITEII